MKNLLSVIIFVTVLGVSWSVHSDTLLTQSVGQKSPSKDDFINSLKPRPQRPKTRGLALVPVNPVKQPGRPKSESGVKELDSATVSEQVPSKTKNTTTVSVSNPIPVVVSAPQISVNLTFDFNSTLLTNSTKATLDNLGKAMQDEQLKPYNFIIEGHTDSKGDATYNWELSLRRAGAVKRYLIENHQIGLERTKVVGKGETELVYPEKPEAPGNRRVVIINAGTD
ncbi:MAG: OmpA family protein [Methylococcales bacterium]